MAGPNIKLWNNNNDGYWMLYKWGDIAEDYRRIEHLPPQIQRVAEAIEQRFGTLQAISSPRSAHFMPTEVAFSSHPIKTNASG